MPDHLRQGAGMTRLLVLLFVVISGPVRAEIAAPTDADYRVIDPIEARLGQLLFYDPILSGNKTVACGTCHHPRFGTGDGVSLSLGDGGIGLGPDRKPDTENLPEQRIPRNAPGLWNLGAHEFRVMFHDGRLELTEDGIRTPLGEDMVAGFDSVLSAQTMFPVLSPDEMAGHYSENDVSQAVRQGLLTGDGGAWDLIAKRVAAIDEYRTAFEALNGPKEITFIDVSNAIAVFMEHEWRSDTSPFDAYLRGERDLPALAEAGRTAFYGDAGCTGCHSGPFQTDHKFHPMAAPQLGPGKAARFESHARDEGRFRVTGRESDLYAFRTPSLRNVALTAPYGHAGSHADLAAFLQDHAKPAAALLAYDRTMAVLPEFETKDWRVLEDPEQVSAIAAQATYSVSLSSEDITALVAFLDALTDPIAVTGRLGVPETVPSGLPVPN